MMVRVGQHNIWRLLRVTFVCALLAALFVGDRITLRRSKVDRLLFQTQLPTSEEDIDETETVEVKTARSEATPRREPPQRIVTALLLPSKVSPPGKVRIQSASALS